MKMRFIKLYAVLWRVSVARRAPNACGVTRRNRECERRLTKIELKAATRSRRLVGRAGTDIPGLAGGDAVGLVNSITQFFHWCLR